MCIAINIRPAAKFITLRVGRRVLVCDWLKLTSLFSTHKHVSNKRRDHENATW
jgi:hypothetical protein